MGREQLEETESAERAAEALSAEAGRVSGNSRFQGQERGSVCAVHARFPRPLLCGRTVLGALGRK